MSPAGKLIRGQADHDIPDNAAHPQSLQPAGQPPQPDRPMSGFDPLQGPIFDLTTQGGKAAAVLAVIGATALI
jgi:hypothetical protein